MATVPGTPIDDSAFGGIPKELRPTQGDLLIAAAMHAQQQTKLAGDIVPFQRKPLDLTGNQQQLDEYKKMMTRDTLSRALGGTTNVLPIKPQDK